MRTIHVLLVGKTGMGKSTLLRQMAVASMDSGLGVLLLDPHGDLADEIVTLVPRRRRNDIVFFDARDPEASPGLNPLRNVSPATRPVTVSAILATFKKLWPDNWGPRAVRAELVRLTAADQDARLTSSS